MTVFLTILVIIAFCMISCLSYNRRHGIEDRYRDFKVGIVGFIVGFVVLGRLLQWYIQ